MKQLLLIAALFITAVAFAQTGSLSGKIIDNNNEHLEAVTVSVQNTLNTNNVANKKYLIGTWGTSYVFPGAPRAVIFSIGYNW